MIYKLRRKNKEKIDLHDVKLPDDFRYWRCAHCNILYCPNEDVFKNSIETPQYLCKKCFTPLGWGTRAYFENLFIFKILPNNHE